MLKTIILIAVVVLAGVAWFAWRRHREMQYLLEHGMEFNPLPPVEDLAGPLASNPARRSEFLSALVAQGISVPSTVPDEEGNFQWLDYEENGEHIFPLFSSADIASEFITSKLQDRPPSDYASFSVLTSGPEFLWANDMSGYRLVINPNHEWTTTLSEQDLAQLKELSTGSTPESNGGAS